MNDSDKTTDEQGIDVSDSAAKRIALLIKQEGNATTMLRVSVSGGGCSGFQYGFSLDDKTNEDDQVFKNKGVKVVADKITMGFIAGSQLDFVEDLIGSFFSLKNPNASSTCGCGSSFAV